MLNINYGKNQELMEKCQQLKEYATFIELLRQHLRTGMEQRDAIMETINYCVEHDILKEILSREKERVVDMLLTECDMEYVKDVFQYNLDQKQSEVDSLKMLKDELEVNNSQLQANYQQLEERNGRLQSEYHLLETNNKHLQESYHQLETNNNRLQEKYIYDLLEAYREAGIPCETAIARVQQKLSDIPLKDIEQIASKVFSE